MQAGMGVEAAGQTPEAAIKPKEGAGGDEVKAAGQTPAAAFNPEDGGQEERMRGQQGPHKGQQASSRR